MKPWMYIPKGGDKTTTAYSEGGDDTMAVYSKGWQQNYSSIFQRVVMMMMMICTALPKSIAAEMVETQRNYICVQM